MKDNGRINYISVVSKTYLVFKDQLLNIIWVGIFYEEIIQAPILVDFGSAAEL
jgi:hypothetical protein